MIRDGSLLNRINCSNLGPITPVAMVLLFDNCWMQFIRVESLEQGCAVFEPSL